MTSTLLSAIPFEEDEALRRGDQLTRQWKLVQLLAGRLGRTLAQLAGKAGHYEADFPAGY